jgi:hypothetical protein
MSTELKNVDLKDLKEILRYDSYRDQPEDLKVIIEALPALISAAERIGKAEALAKAFEKLFKSQGAVDQGTREQFFSYQAVNFAWVDTYHALIEFFESASRPVVVEDKSRGRVYLDSDEETPPYPDYDPTTNF